MVNNDMLWRHFVELTTNFLAPFGPFLRGATPSQGDRPSRRLTPCASSSCFCMPVCQCESHVLRLKGIVLRRLKLVPRVSA
jgi:hypothetical protein